DIRPIGRNGGCGDTLVCRLRRCEVRRRCEDRRSILEEIAEQLHPHSLSAPGSADFHNHRGRTAADLAGEPERLFKLIAKLPERCLNTAAAVTAANPGRDLPSTKRSSPGRFDEILDLLERFAQRPDPLFTLVPQEHQALRTDEALGPVE